MIFFMDFGYGNLQKKQSYNYMGLPSIKPCLIFIFRKRGDYISFIIKEIKLCLIFFIYVEHRFGHSFIVKKKQSVVLASGFAQHYAWNATYQTFSFVFFVFFLHSF